MARRKPPVIAEQLLDQLLAGADAKRAFEKDGLLDALKKALAERVLNAEIDHHLEAGEADGRPNSRNGYGKKRVLTETATRRARCNAGRRSPPVSACAPDARRTRRRRESVSGPHEASGDNRP